MRARIFVAVVAVSSLGVAGLLEVRAVSGPQLHGHHHGRTGLSDADPGLVEVLPAGEPGRGTSVEDRRESDRLPTERWSRVGRTTPVGPDASAL